MGLDTQDVNDEDQDLIFLTLVSEYEAGRFEKVVPDKKERCEILFSAGRSPDQRISQSLITMENAGFDTQAQDVLSKLARARDLHRQADDLVKEATGQALAPAPAKATEEVKAAQVQAWADIDAAKAEAAAIIKQEAREAKERAK